MTLTPLMLKALDKLPKYWDYLWTHPVEWDAKQWKFIYTPISRKLLPWAIALYLISFPVYFLLLLMASAPMITSNKLPLKDYMIILLFFGLVSTLIAIETCFLLFAKSPTHTANCVLHLYRSWEKSKESIIA